MPERLGADRRPGRLEGLHGRLAGGPLALAGPGQLLVELLLAAEQAAAGHPHVVEDHLGGVRGADAHLLELLALAEPRGLRRHDEAGLAPRPEGRVDRGHHHVDVGDAAVGDPRLGAVEDPLVLGLVVDGRVRSDDTSDPASASDTAKAAIWILSGVPKHCGPHSTSCSGVPLAAMPARPRVLPKMARAMPASPQAISSLAIGQQQAALVEERLADEVEGVEADLGRLLDDRPGGLLPLVPLVAGGSDDVLGEVVDPLLDLQLVLVEVEGEFGHDASLRSGPVPAAHLLSAIGCSPSGSPAEPPTGPQDRGLFCSYSIVT